MDSDQEDELNFDDQDEELAEIDDEDPNKETRQYETPDKDESLINHKRYDVYDQEEENEFQENDLVSLIQNQEIKENRKARANFLNMIITRPLDQGDIELSSNMSTFDFNVNSNSQKLGMSDKELEYFELNPYLNLSEDLAAQIIEKKKREKEYQFEREKAEFLKQSRKIRQNPEEYRNLIKGSVLIEISCALYMLMKYGGDEEILSDVLSRLNLEDVIFMESMKQNNYTVLQMAKTTCYNLQKVFKFRWNREEKTLYENLSEGSELSYAQMTLISYMILKYLGVHVRFSKILDLRFLNLDKKHNTQNPSSKQSNKATESAKSSLSSQQQSRNNFIETAIRQKKMQRFSNMASRISNNIIEQSINQNDDEDKEIESDVDEQIPKWKLNSKRKVHTLEDDEKDDDNYGDKEKQSLKENTTFEDFFSTFKYEKKKMSSSNRVVNLKKEAENQEEEMILVKEQFKKISPIDNKQTVEEIKNKKEEEDKFVDVNSFTFFKKPKNINNQTKSTIEKPAQTVAKSCNDYLLGTDIKFWLEIFCEKTNTWICFDAVTINVLEKHKIESKQYGMPVLFILGFNELEFENPYMNSFIKKNKPQGQLRVFDITDVHCERFPKVQYSRKVLGLDYWWKEFIQINSFLGDEKHLKEQYRQQITSERSLSYNIQKSQIPQSYSEFKANNIYILKSMLRKYTGIKPGAVKTDITFKEEDVYLKEDITGLHAKTRWRTLKRQVRAGEQPLKQVQSIMGNKKMVDLFGIWQTDELIYKVGSDGSLPRNEYGNWEIFAMDPPEGTVLIGYPGLPKLLKKEKIDFVEAVSGFELNSSGGSHVVKKGILAHAKDEERIRKIYEQNYEQMKIQQAIDLKKNLFSMWRKIFKGVLLKRSISERIHKINM